MVRAFAGSFSSFTVCFYLVVFVKVFWFFLILFFLPIVLCVNGFRAGVVLCLKEKKDGILKESH